MKTVTIPEQVIKPLIDNLCKREGTCKLETISKLVDQSGLELTNSQYCSLNVWTNAGYYRVFEGK